MSCACKNKSQAPVRNVVKKVANRTATTRNTSGGKRIIRRIIR